MPLLKAGSNSLFGNSFFIFITRFFPSLASLLVMILYSRYLPPAVYGNYQRFWIQLNVIYPLACFGIHVLIVTYSRGFILSLLKKIKTAHYVIYAIWILFLSLAFALLEYSTLNITFIVPFLFIVVWSSSTVLESFLIVCRNYASLIIANMLYAAAFCFLHWYVLRGAFSLPVLFNYLLIIAGLRMCIYAGITIKDMKSGVAVADESFGITKVKSLWLHLGVYDVTQMLFSWIDKFIIAFVLTASLSAVYYNGSQNIPFLPLLLNAAGSAVLMQLAGSNKTDETANIISFMNRLGRLLSCIIFPIFFFLFFFRHELIIIILTEKYAQAIPVFAVSILVLPVRSYSFTTVLQRLHKGNIINLGSLADIVLACALMYPLYLWFGLPGVALSFVITTYLQAAFYLLYSAKLLQVNPFRLIPAGNWLIKFAVFGGLFLAMHRVSTHFFGNKTGLVFGGMTMSAIILVSLLLELRVKEKY